VKKVNNVYDNYLKITKSIAGRTKHPHWLHSGHLLVTPEMR